MPGEEAELLGALVDEQVDAAHDPHPRGRRGPRERGRPLRVDDVEEDGSVTMLGRGSVSINSGGEKIYPEEVEGAVKAHPDVFDTLVVGVPDERFGQRVSAVVATRGGARPSMNDIVAAARNEIAGYKVPRSVWFVDEIKRSPAGKPDYKWAKGVTEDREADDHYTNGNA